MELAERVNELVNAFPPKEVYNLSSQTRKAADSVSLNTAEGSTGLSNPEQIKFLKYANRSIMETVTCLMKAKRRGYTDEATYNDLYSQYEKLCIMIQSQIRGLE